MIWKTFRVLGGTIFVSPSARENEVRLNENTLKAWEIYKGVV